MSTLPTESAAPNRAPAPAHHPAPMPTQERVGAIDTLRGFALLGILPVNMPLFAQPFFLAIHPRHGGESWADYCIYYLVLFFFELKMVTILSMLFGAGLGLMLERGTASGWLHFRRSAWLLVFGLVHAYLFWYGDILFFYGLLGLLLWWFRHWTPRRLLILGFILVVLAGGVAGFTKGGMLLVYQRYGESLIQNRPENLSDAEYQQAVQDYLEFRKTVLEPSAKLLAKMSAKVRAAGFLEMVQLRAPETLMTQVVFLLDFGWRLFGMMLIGIALARTGGLAAAWSPRAYRMCLLVGYGLGLPLIGWGAWEAHACNYDVLWLSMWGRLFNYYGSLLVAAGHFGLVMLAVQASWFPTGARRLAAVGQLALTNYFAQTLICTFVFHGWGLAQFGLWHRWQWTLLVLAIWALQLSWSQPYLARFRFGPAEWLWRTLAYRQWQPWRRGAAPTAPVALDSGRSLP